MIVTPKKKPHFIGLRVEDDLYQKIEAEAALARISISEYIRRELRKGTVSVRQEIVADVHLIKKMLAELGKIGSNINQIAHFYNSLGEDAADMRKLCTKALSAVYSMKYGIEALGGELRGYANPNRHSEP